jgi:hypothetical protein
MPVFNTISPETQEVIIAMANTDIRSFKKMFADLSAQVTDQGLELATTGAKVVSMEATMVIENTFTVLKAAFVAAGEFWVYDLVHDMNSLTPDVAIYDTDPATGKAADLQLIQTIGLTPNSFRIELNADEYAGNNFPLVVNVQAKNTPVSAIGQWKLIPTGDRYWRLLDGKLDRSADGQTVENAAFVVDVTAAVMSPTQQRIYLKKLDGTIAYVDNGNLGAGLTAQALAEYDAVVAAVGAITL